MRRIRLLLLDDHILFREGLRRLLSSESDFETVAECGTPGEALDCLARSEVDIVLLDFDLEDDTGTRFISAAQRAGYQGRILMVTAGMNPLDISVARRLGISGVFLKHNSPTLLLEAIRVTARGGYWSDPPSGPANSEIVKARRGQDADAGLTPRERNVLRGVFEGQTNKEMAHEMGVSLSSVKATLQNLFEKMGVRTRGQLVRIAIERSVETAQER
jgi:DNA-binding NarL/FixJ family response regulator